MVDLAVRASFGDGVHNVAPVVAWDRHQRCALQHNNTINNNMRGRNTTKQREQTADRVRQCHTHAIVAKAAEVERAVAHKNPLQMNEPHARNQVRRLDRSPVLLLLLSPLSPLLVFAPWSSSRWRVHRRGQACAAVHFDDAGESDVVVVKLRVGRAQHEHGLVVQRSLSDYVLSGEKQTKRTKKRVYLCRGEKEGEHAVRELSLRVQRVQKRRSQGLRAALEAEAQNTYQKTP